MSVIIYRPTALHFTVGCIVFADDVLLLSASACKAVTVIIRYLYGLCLNS